MFLKINKLFYIIISCDFIDRTSSLQQNSSDTYPTKNSTSASLLSFFWYEPSICVLFGLSMSRSAFHNFLKGREVTLPCSYWSRFLSSSFCFSLYLFLSFYLYIYLSPSTSDPWLGPRANTIYSNPPSNCAQY